METNFLNIYQCWDLIREIEAKAEANDGMLSDGEMQALVLAQTTSITKMEKLAGYVKYLESFQETAKAEIDRLSKQKQSAANRVESIKQWLLPYLEEHGPIVAGLRRLSTRTSEAVVLDDKFYNPLYGETRSEFVPNKPKIKEDIKHGIEVKGAALEKRVHVQIK